MWIQIILINTFAAIKIHIEKRSMEKNSEFNKTGFFVLLRNFKNVEILIARILSLNARKLIAQLVQIMKTCLVQCTCLLPLFIAFDLSA